MYRSKRWITTPVEASNTLDRLGLLVRLRFTMSDAGKVISDFDEDITDSQYDAWPSPNASFWKMSSKASDIHENCSAISDTKYLPKSVPASYNHQQSGSTPFGPYVGDLSSPVTY